MLSSMVPTPESDVFSYGATLFEIMTQDHRLPFEDDAELKEHYKEGNVFFEDPPGDNWPAEWRNLVVKCMAFRPSDRPSLDDIICELSQLCNC
eukprot:jgi/Botrbrau1/14730/Bobra.0108s0074.1